MLLFVLCSESCEYFLIFQIDIKTECITINNNKYFKKTQSFLDDFVNQNIFLTFMLKLFSLRNPGIIYLRKKK